MAARRDVDVSTLERVLVKRHGRQFLCWFLCCATDEQKNPEAVAGLAGGYALMAPHGAVDEGRRRLHAATLRPRRLRQCDGSCA
jgi:hypothetical protein